MRYSDSVSDNDEYMKDIWDGSALKAMMTNGKLGPTSVPLMISIDGIAVFKSSTVSLWPVALVVLNLPPNVRMNSENIILGGFWIGPSKPDVKSLLDPVIESICELSSKGLKIKTPDSTLILNPRIVLGIFDLPAKAAVLCSKQYNGRYGCSVCTHPGYRLPNNARVYKPMKYGERTHSSVMEAAKIAEESGSAQKGVIGMSPLATAVDLVDGVPVDYMHSVLEGVVRLLMKYWFNSSYHSHPSYLGRKLLEIDTMLLKQRPPNEFSRAPRSIAKHLKYWKASELRNWLLFYSLPILIEHLPSLYWHHYALLVCALHIFLGSSINQDHINAAEQMLIDFYLLMPELYGDSSCTHNVHLLSHLGKYVRLWGPLWTHSTFGFESNNGSLKKFFHGRYHIHKQLIFNLNIFITLQLLHPQLANDLELATFFNHMQRKELRSNMVILFDHTYRVGPCHLSEPTSEQKEILQLGDCENISVFYRLFKDGIMFYATLYKEGLKRNNTICVFKENDTIQVGEIVMFIMLSYPVALVNKFHQNAESLFNKAGPPCRPSLLPYKEANLLGKYIMQIDRSSSSLLTVKLQDILGKAVLVQCDTGTYVVFQPNNFEHS